MKTNPKLDLSYYLDRFDDALRERYNGQTFRNGFAAIKEIYKGVQAGNREGLYSSHLTTWRRQREQGEMEALAPKKRGRKPTANPLADELRKLRAENARLSRRLEQAEIIIDVQKIVSSLLGISLPETKTGEENS